MTAPPLASTRPLCTANQIEQRLTGVFWAYSCWGVVVVSLAEWAPSLRSGSTHHMASTVYPHSRTAIPPVLTSGGGSNPHTMLITVASGLTPGHGGDADPQQLAARTRPPSWTSLEAKPPEGTPGYIEANLITSGLSLRRGETNPVMLP